MDHYHSPSFFQEVSRVRDLALQRLLELRQPEGRWRTFFDSSAFVSSSFIIMLRTTGLIARPGLFEREAGLVVNLIRQVNPDGGFYKYPGSPSSPNITRVAALVLRMASGQLPPKNRPRSWFRVNPSIDETSLQDIAFTLGRAERFLGRRRRSGRWAFDREFILPAKMLTAYAEEKRTFFPPLLITPSSLLWANRSQAAGAVLSQLNTILRKMLPAFSIVSHGILVDNPLMRLILSLNRNLHRQSLEEMTCLLLSQQNGNGGWFYNIPYTIANMIALVEAGIPADHPAILRALDYLETNLCPDGNGRLKLNIMNADIWDTGLAVISYLAIPGRSSSDGEIRKSIEFLLDSQHADGSYAWASHSHNDADNDSTAHAVQALALASRTAGPVLLKRIEGAVRRGLAYLLSHQAKSGGFSVWQTTFARSRPGPLALWKQFFFDIPSADVTARVISALAESGLSVQDDPAGNGLQFIIKNQSSNGGWWCRWWAGYVSGTCYVLEALGKLGFRLKGGSRPPGSLLFRVHGSLVKGVGFLLQHQNQDGGWGETVKADSSMRYAGIGKSRPLQTSFVISSLLGCGFRVEAPEIKRALEYLLSTATDDGRWEDDQVTFSFFSRNLYYHYPLMNYILPLNALTACLKATAQPKPDAKFTSTCVLG
jgi:squalene-hopene/tetraprenyl-beta-curcumene cyclase